MIRVCALPVALFITAIMALAADQSPEKKSEEPDSFDIEPQVLKQNLSDLTNWAAIGQIRPLKRRATSLKVSIRK